MDSLAEFTQFLQPNQRLDLKSVALTHILGNLTLEIGNLCIQYVIRRMVSDASTISGAQHHIPCIDI